MSLYAYVLLFSGIIPFIYSFNKKVSFYKKWPVLFLSIFIVMIPYLIWDHYFTENGIWGFNSRYISGVYLFSLPMEEILFFIVIPYCCVFTYYALVYYFPNKEVSKRITNTIVILIYLLSIIVLINNYNLAYTSINILFLLITLTVAFVFMRKVLRVFLWIFPVILIPFFIVNGILTGLGIEEEVVWYNSSQFLGIRILTIPLEDVFYAFSLLLANLVLTKWFEHLFTKTKKGS